MIGDKPLDVGQLFGELANQLRSNALLAISAVVVMAIASLAIETYVQAGSMILEGFVNLIAQYYVSRFALSAAGLLPADAPGRFGSYWGMNIITNIAIVVGTLLLTLPGVYLGARWFIATPIILAEDKTAGEGMSDSWEIMQPSVWSLVGAILVLGVIGFGAAFVPFFLYGDQPIPLSVQAFSSLCLSATSVLGWLMAVGAYRLVARPERSLEEVFA